ncbi:hypothetical protein ES319_A12G240600v1 [Gossypium barbadense]|uniref:Uncharacterized protein n=1 Tax=Gossypium barbadense TaxID=3634 RepID=A0A5J5TIG3_GOSBA|nr:hypothetical protein ES319_A12G240600v1 [Gossypium barbadense]
MGDMEFQQRWEFRRNDDELDSSFDDSVSSDGSLIRKQKLVSRLISLGDDESSEISRLKQKDNENPAKEDQINVGKVKKRKTRNMSRRNKMKKDSVEKVDLQKGETSGYDHHAPLDDLKNFMDSLLKDLKVTRESLLKWLMDEMQKLVTDHPRGKKPGDDKVQLQTRKKSKKVEDQNGKVHMESTRLRNSSKTDKCTRVQQQNKLQVLIRDEENNNKQHQNGFGYGMDRSLIRFPTGNTATGSTDYFNTLGDRLGPGKVVELITSSKRKGDSSLIAAANPNLQTSDTDQNVQVHCHTGVVLAIEAQKAKSGSMKRSAKGKETVDLRDHHQVPEDQASHGQGITTAGAGTNIEKPGSSAPWAIYPTLPTLLNDPKFANQGLDASSYNHVVPRVNQMLEPGSNQGSFPVIPPDETIQRFAWMGSSTPTSGIGTGFPFPFHQGLDFGLSIPNPKQMNGGATKFSSGSYNLPEHNAAHNHHSHGRLISYQMQNLKDGHLFLQ